MKTLLQTILLLTFIATSCKQKVESKTEKIDEIKISIDTIYSIKTTKSEKEKVLLDYDSIQKPTITKSDYLQFFNEVLRPSGLVVNKKIVIFEMDSVYWNLDLVKLTQKSNDNSINELIDLNDIKFIYEQTKSQKNVTLESEKISRKKIERKYLDKLMNENNDLENYWNEVYKLGSGYYSLELPLFSIDKTIVFFRYSYSCGSLCANAGTYIYKKINGKWEWIGNIGGELVS